MQVGSSAAGSSPARISPAALATIRAAVRQAGHSEACGLLFGEGRVIRTATLAANVAADPAHSFEIDPTHLFDAQRRDRAGPDRLLGCWHSHPNGRPTPSLRDRAGVTDMGWLWLIAWADGLSAWQPTADGFAEVVLELPDDGGDLALPGARR